MKFIVLMSLFFVAQVSAESCVTLLDDTYSNNASTLEQCTEFIVMTAQNYNSMQLEQFDPTAYDYGFEGVIKMFIAGIGVGAILSMIFKLRR